MIAMDNQFVCPHCKKDIAITEALSHKMREEADKRFEEEKRKLFVANKEWKILEQKRLEKEQESIKKETEDKIREKVQRENEYKIKDSQNELNEQRDRNKKLQDDVLKLTKEIRAMIQRDQDREITYQKKLLEERTKIQSEVSKQEKDRFSMKELDLQKQLDDTKKALEDAQRKASQSSQQLQGEVLELEIERLLREEFPQDTISPVKKGAEGADILQEVMANNRTSGAILWETKRSKDWSKKWLPKLREDSRQAGADVCILVTNRLPPEIKTFGIIEKVWITSFECAIPLAYVLRGALHKINAAKASSANKDERLELLYLYLTSEKFLHRFEAQVEGIVEMQNNLETERRSMSRLWKSREVSIRRLINNVSSMYGELQGIVGQALPSIKNLELPDIVDTTEEDSVKQEDNAILKDQNSSLF